MGQVVAVVIVCILITLAVAVVYNRVKWLRRNRHNVTHTYSVEDAQFRRAVESLLGGALVGGNAIETYENGCRYFPAMLDAIRRAEKSIHMESFIYMSDNIGHEFSEAMLERSKAGVEVRLIFDFLGSWKLKKEHVQKLRAGGIKVHIYRPVRLRSLFNINNRTHRKILVIDGKVAFTGGAGIADAWNCDADFPECWRDNQYRLSGPAVAHVQAAFMDNWMQRHNEVPKDDSVFPELASAGALPCQVFLSSPETGARNAKLMYLISIACASKTIRLGNAYFLPDPDLVEALIAARKRGVDIEIVFPLETDFDIAHWASCSRWKVLLENGIRLYRYQGSRYHCKVFIVDDYWVSVGSANFDNRSFSINDEMNLNVLDREFARDQAGLFEKDKNRSKMVTLEDWEGRALWQKIRDRISALLEFQL